MLEGFNPPLPTCDFCSQEHVDLVLNFRAINVITGETEDGIPVPLTLDWLACPDCAELLKRGKFKQLLSRAVVFYMSKHDIPQDRFFNVRLSVRDGWREAFGNRMPGL